MKSSAYPSLRVLPQSIFSIFIERRDEASDKALNLVTPMTAQEYRRQLEHVPAQSGWTVTRGLLFNDWATRTTSRVWRHTLKLQEEVGFRGSSMLFVKKMFETWAYYVSFIMLALWLCLAGCTPAAAVSPTPTAPATATPACDPAIWTDIADPLLTAFLDTSEIAQDASAPSLGELLRTLRQTKRDFTALSLPSCFTAVQLNLARAMDFAAEGYSARLENNDRRASEYFVLATRTFWSAAQALPVVGVTADPRLINTAGLIWGGLAPNAATATALVGS